MFLILNLGEFCVFHEQLIFVCKMMFIQISIFSMNTKPKRLKVNNIFNQCYYICMNMCLERVGFIVRWALWTLARPVKNNSRASVDGEKAIRALSTLAVRRS